MHSHDITHSNLRHCDVMKVVLDTPACVNDVIGTSNRLREVQGNFPQYQRERVISLASGYTKFVSGGDLSVSLDKCSMTDIPVRFSLRKDPALDVLQPEKTRIYSDSEVSLRGPDKSVKLSLTSTR